MAETISCRNFHLTLVSASNLPNVRKRLKMKVYAKVCFNSNTKTEKETPVDKENEINPAWNHRMGYTIAETGMQYHGLMLVIKLYAKRTFGDRYIAEAHVSVKELFDNASQQGLSANLSLPLKKGSASIEDAMLNISYHFGEAILKEKPSFWRQALRSGAVIVFRAVMITQFGTDVEVPIFKDLDNIIGNDAP